MRRLGRWVIAGVVLLLGRGQRPRELPPPERVVEGGSPAPKSELLVSILFLLSAAFAIAFVVVYAGGADTQLLGLRSVSPSSRFASALVVSGVSLSTAIGRRRGSRTRSSSTRPRWAERWRQIFDESRTGTPDPRRKLLGLPAAAAGVRSESRCSTPARLARPGLRTPAARRPGTAAPGWSTRRAAVSADDVEPDPPTPPSPRAPTAHSPPGRRRPGRAGAAALPPAARDWAPKGSWPTRRSAPTRAARSRSTARRSSSRLGRGPALVCPCHYSTFDPARGGTVVFGPAGRPLPQLPLGSARGELRAGGGFSGPSAPPGGASADMSSATRRSASSTSAPAPRRSCARRCATSSPTTGRSCSGRSRSTRSSSSSLTGIYLDALLRAEPKEDRLPRPLRAAPGAQMSEAYRSAVDISFNVKAGLLIRQTHHWAADVFVVAIVLHLLRVFFTGAFRKPRDLVYYVGVEMLDARAPRGFPRLLAAWTTCSPEWASRSPTPVALRYRRRRRPRSPALGWRVPRGPHFVGAPVHRARASCPGR